jgi:hypothetical protein
MIRPHGVGDSGLGLLLSSERLARAHGAGVGDVGAQESAEMGLAQLAQNEEMVQVACARPLCACRKSSSN